MNVNLIDYTGKESTDSLYAAKLLIYTKSTRLEQGSELKGRIDNIFKHEIYKELEYIANTIRSSWEFVDYTFQIKGVTRAFTHQFVRTRTASFAQQTMRTITLENIEVLMPETIENNMAALSYWDSAIHQIKKAYKGLIENGIPPEDARGILPTNVLTNIIVKMNLRTLADMVGKRDNLRAQGEYIDVIKKMSSLAIEAHPWTKNFLYPDRSHTPILNKILNSIDVCGKLVIGDEQIDMKEVYKELDKLKGIWG